MILSLDVFYYCCYCLNGYIFKFEKFKKECFLLDKYFRLFDLIVDQWCDFNEVINRFKVYEEFICKL